MSATDDSIFFYQIIITFVSIIFWVARPSRYYYARIL
jgi:hypothetical protein